MKATGLILIFLTAGLLAVSCGIFDTREPESPSSPTNPWTPPPNPAGVLRNIESAFTTRDAVLYMKCFAQPGSSDSTYVFRPDQTSSAYDPTLFDGWGYESEQIFITSLFFPNILPPDSICILEFIPESEPEGEYYPLYGEQYILTIHHTLENIPYQFSGRADVRFDRNDNGAWVIISWRDEKIGDNPNLSELKAVLAN